MTDQPIPLFKGEAMLLSWGDTSSRGKTVTFALHPDECGDAHPFRGLGTGKTGQRFAIVAVPITDDEEVSPEALDQAALEDPAATGSTPAEPKQPVASGETRRKSWYEQKPSQRAGILCHDSRFVEFLAGSYPVHMEEAENDTAKVLRKVTGVHTRAEYDTNHAARSRFEAIETRFRRSWDLETEAR